MNQTVFNIHKDYGVDNGSLFLQQEPGLLDSINKTHPEIWRLYKLMKKLDWDENEFDYSPCMMEFKSCSRASYEIMIKTLAWQWEADSVAAHNIAPVVAPFVTSSELWSLWLEISKNEVVHGLTYSEIVRNSFEDPQETLRQVIGEKEAYTRLTVVADAMKKVKNIGARLTMGQLSRDSEEARDAIMMFTIALLALERIQFMSSFAITFAFAEAGQFLPIGKAVQKICNDELNVHVAADKEILRNELSLSVGQQSFNRIKDQAAKLIREVTETELRWTQYLFKDNRQLVGCTENMVKDWVLYGVTDVYNALRLPNEFQVVTKNPLSYMTDWIDINSHQPSPQEEKVGNYLLGGVENTLVNKTYNLDDL